jgi:hypothetical protein
LRKVYYYFGVMGTGRLSRVLLGVGEIFSELETIEGKKYGEDIHSKIRYTSKITTVGL